MKSNEEMKKNTKQAIEKKDITKKQNSAKKNAGKKVEESSVKKEKNTSTKSNTKKSETIKKGSTKNTTKKTTTTVKKEKINEPKKTEKVEQKEDLKKEKIEKVEKKEDLKKENTKQTVINQSEKFITKEETRKVGIVVAVIAAAFCIFFIASKIMDKNSHKDDIFKESLDVAEIQYKDILISKMLKQKQSEYYVLVEYSKDENLKTYEGYIKNYEENYSKKDVLRIYTAQLNNAFNKSYYSDEDSYEIDKLSFSKTTLVKVSNGNITETYTGNDISIKIQGLIGEASN